MSASDGNVMPPTRRTAPGYGQKKSPTMGMGPVTQRFFAEGEEQEASGYEKLVEATPLTSPRLEFESFDKIPRKRRPLLMIVGVLSLAAIGVVAWKNTRGFPKVSESARAATQTVVASQAKAEPVVTLPQPIVITPAAASVHALTAEPSVAAPKAVATTAASEPAPAPPRPAIQPAETATEKPTEPARTVRRPVEAREVVPAADDTESPARESRSHHAPLRGYVWSPEKNALVPAESTMPAVPTAAESQPSARRLAPEPSVAPIERPIAPDEGRSAPAETTPAPLDQGRTPRESAPILE